jgi:soluble lytic murein transglycosylase-like protein
MVTTSFSPVAWALCLGLALGARDVAAQERSSVGTGRTAADWSAAGGDLFGLNRADDELPVDAHSSRLPPLGQPLSREIEAAAQAHGLDPKLLHALVIQESGYRVSALSSAGAAGLTQLMPATASDLGVVDRFDPVENLRGGAEYLARQINRFRRLDLALAAYNAGPNRVAALGRVPAIAETRYYVSAVIACYLALSAGREIRSSAECRDPEAAP